MAQRYERFRALGKFDTLAPAEVDSAVAAASAASKPRYITDITDTTATIILLYYYYYFTTGQSSTHEMETKAA